MFKEQEDKIKKLLYLDFSHFWKDKLYADRKHELMHDINYNDAVEDICKILEIQIERNIKDELKAQKKLNK